MKDACNCTNDNLQSYLEHSLMAHLNSYFDLTFCSKSGIESHNEMPLYIGLFKG